MLFCFYGILCTFHLAKTFVKDIDCEHEQNLPVAKSCSKKQTLDFEDPLENQNRIRLLTDINYVSKVSVSPFLLKQIFLRMLWIWKSWPTFVETLRIVRLNEHQFRSSLILDGLLKTFVPKILHISEDLILFKSQDFNFCFTCIFPLNWIENLRNFFMSTNSMLSQLSIYRDTYTFSKPFAFKKLQCTTLLPNFLMLLVCRKINPFSIKKSIQKWRFMFGNKLCV